MIIKARFGTFLVLLTVIRIKRECFIADWTLNRQRAEYSGDKGGSFEGGESKCFPNTPTKEHVCGVGSVWIHLLWAEQACWQGNTSGEGQPSTLWLCWRQWHNSNSCRVLASSFLNLLSLWGGLQLKPGMKQDWVVTKQPPDWSPVRMKRHKTTWYSFATRPVFVMKADKHLWKCMLIGLCVSRDWTVQSSRKKEFQ